MKAINATLLFGLFLIPSWDAMALGMGEKHGPGIYVEATKPQHVYFGRDDNPANPVPPADEIKRKKYRVTEDGQCFDDAGQPLAYHPETLGDDRDDLVYDEDNPKDRITETFDDQGRVTHYGFNCIGTWNQTLYPDGTVEVIDFLKNNGYLVTRIDLLGQVTRYQYDVEDRLVREVDAQGWEKRYVYPPGGADKEGSANPTAPAAKAGQTDATAPGPARQAAAAPLAMASDIVVQDPFTVWGTPPPPPPQPQPNFTDHISQTYNFSQNTSNPPPNSITTVCNSPDRCSSINSSGTSTISSSTSYNVAGVFDIGAKVIKGITSVFIKNGGKKGTTTVIGNGGKKTVTNTVGNTVANVAKTSRFLAGGRSYPSFPALKRALGSAGPGKEWHHVVEQSQESKFGVEAIQNTKNAVAIPKAIHERISAFYNSSQQKFTDGMRVRHWLMQNKTFDEQYQFGLETMKRFGVNIK